MGTIAAINTGVVMETTRTTASTEKIMIVQRRKLSGSLLSIMSISLENLRGEEDNWLLKHLNPILNLSLYSEYLCLFLKV